VVGHFSTHSPLVTNLLEPALDAVLAQTSATVWLIGQDGDRFRARYIGPRAWFSDRVHATGALTSDALSEALARCDVLLQPYPDGVSARRTSTLAALRAGKPVVTNGGRLTEPFWRHDPGVELVDAPDPAALGATLVRLLGDDVRLACVAQAGRQLYARRFDVSHALASLNHQPDRGELRSQNVEFKTQHAELRRNAELKTQDSERGTRSSHSMAATAPVAAGHYAEKQLNCRSSVIAFSHRARFETAVRLAGQHRTLRLLDYGSGDGTFLTLAAQNFAACVGADLARDQVDDCRRRLASLRSVSFCEIGDLRGDRHDHAYAVVTCMEVLEHCTPAVVDTVLADLARLVAPDGRVIISVPIETGPSFLLKYAVRTVAGWRGLGDYKHYEHCPVGEAVRMIAATKHTRIERPVYDDGRGGFHSHYGFNWRSLAESAGRVLRLERTMFSPFNTPGGLLDSQAWLVCRPHDSR
jgi:2-polyprenyl-3-methyl-5-hydroxy-6-metoxy-1,4-benzoquinol methylase